MKKKLHWVRASLAAISTTEEPQLICDKKLEYVQV